MHTPWWTQTTIYQIYPKSYRDANGDGVGDLRGIIDSLDHIRALGFETIWLSPFFASPDEDGGYDISDYCAVDPRFGTMADAEALIAEAHARGLKVVFDLVMNHTSIEHPWFRESRASRTSAKRDWYLWHPGRGGRRPNNWKAMIGGSGWHRDTATNEWYFASFLPCQPDLNYHNPAVRAAMFDVVRFWLRKGVDGFRLDIFNCIGKDEAFTDNPRTWRYIPSIRDHTEAFWQRRVHTMNHPSSLTLARELRAVMDEFPGDRMLIGEVSGPDDAIRRYLGDGSNGLHLIFLFEYVDFAFRASFFREVLQRHTAAFAAPLVPTCVFSNHDVRRAIVRAGGDPRAAALLALLQFTVRGVPITYYGEEIGMLGGDFPLSASTDPVARRHPWIPKGLTNALGILINREDSRTPMRWDDSPSAGFSGATPWLPIDAEPGTSTVQHQTGQPEALLEVYRALLSLRRSQPALAGGAMAVHPAHPDAPDVLAYEREQDGARVLVLIHFGNQTQRYPLPLGTWQVAYAIPAALAATNLSGPIVELPARTGLVLTSA